MRFHHPPHSYASFLILLLLFIFTSQPLHIYNPLQAIGYPGQYYEKFLCRYGKTHYYRGHPLCVCLTNHPDGRGDCDHGHLHDARIFPGLEHADDAGHGPAPGNFLRDQHQCLSRSCAALQRGLWDSAAWDTRDWSSPGDQLRDSPLPDLQPPGNARYVDAHQPPGKVLYRRPGIRSCPLPRRRCDHRLGIPAVREHVLYCLMGCHFPMFFWEGRRPSPQLPFRIDNAAFLWIVM